MDEREQGPQVDSAAVHDSLMEIVTAVDAHFGGREPSEEELRAFLRQRLLADGRSEHEADEILRDL